MHLPLLSSPVNYVDSISSSYTQNYEENGCIEGFESPLPRFQGNFRELISSQPNLLERYTFFHDVVRKVGIMGSWNTSKILSKINTKTLDEMFQFSTDILQMFHHIHRVNFESTDLELAARIIEIASLSYCLRVDQLHNALTRWQATESQRRLLVKIQPCSVSLLNLSQDQIRIYTAIRRAEVVLSNDDLRELGAKLMGESGASLTPNAESIVALISQEDPLLNLDLPSPQLETCHDDLTGYNTQEQVADLMENLNELTLTGCSDAGEGISPQVILVSTPTNAETSMEPSIPVTTVGIGARKIIRRSTTVKFVGKLAYNLLADRRERKSLKRLCHANHPTIQTENVVPEVNSNDACQITPVNDEIISNGNVNESFPVIGEGEIPSPEVMRQTMCPEKYLALQRLRDPNANQSRKIMQHMIRDSLTTAMKDFDLRWERKKAERHDEVEADIMEFHAKMSRITEAQNVQFESSTNFSEVEDAEETYLAFETNIEQFIKENPKVSERITHLDIFSCLLDRDKSSKHFRLCFVAILSLLAKGRIEMIVEPNSSLKKYEHRWDHAMDQKRFSEYHSGLELIYLPSLDLSCNELALKIPDAATVIKNINSPVAPQAMATIPPAPKKLNKRSYDCRDRTPPRSKMVRSDIMTADSHHNLDHDGTYESGKDSSSRQLLRMFEQS